MDYLLFMQVSLTSTLQSIMYPLLSLLTCRHLSMNGNIDTMCVVLTSKCIPQMNCGFVFAISIC